MLLKPFKLEYDSYMKLPKIIYLLLIAYLSFAAIPAGYYDDAAGLSGTSLRQALHDIIDGHTVKSYDYLWTAFASTDIRTSLGSDYIWCMYTEQEFHHDEDQQGKYTMDQAITYNREHSWPKSWANETSPHYSDLFHLYPVQSNSNTNRSNLPYGEVSTATYTTANGTKKGDARSGLGYTGTVFEPIDEYKGDLARTYFYISTRYYGEDGTWNDVEMADGCELKQWALDMLMDWHQLDSVSQKEIDRNDAVYAIQGNRNPYIDHPEYVDSVFASGTGGGSGSSIDSTEIFFSEYIEGSSNNKSLEIYNNTGQSVDLSFIELKTYYNGNTSAGNTATLNGNLANGDVYVIANSSANAAILAETDLTSGVCNFNGNDAVEMLYNGNRIDIIGTIGSSNDFAIDMTMVRKSGIGQGATVYSALEWDTYSQDETSYLGFHTISEAPTAISLQSFNVSYENGVVLLTWTTASETENVAFQIYRNNDFLDMVEGSGTTSVTHYYEFIDKNLIPGQTYTYILNDIDYCGQIRSHENMSVSISIPSNGQIILPEGSIGDVYPNPFNPTAILPISLIENTDVKISLYDILGKKYRDILCRNFAKGDYSIPINAINLPSGAYVLHVQIGMSMKTQKIILSK